MGASPLISDLSVPELNARHNIAPSTNSMVIRDTEKGHIDSFIVAVTKKSKEIVPTRGNCIFCKRGSRFLAPSTDGSATVLTLPLS